MFGITLIAPRSLKTFRSRSWHGISRGHFRPSRGAHRPESLNDGGPRDGSHRGDGPLVRRVPQHGASTRSNPPPRARTPDPR